LKRAKLSLNLLLSRAGEIVFPRWQTPIDEAWRIRQHLDTPSLYRSRIARMRETLAFIEYVRTLHKDFLS